MIKTVAWANTKYNRGKNLLSGTAIILTTILILLIVTIGLGAVNTQNAAVNKLYPTWHAMYRGVSEETASQLVEHADIEKAGVRQDVGSAKLGAGELFVTYLDKQALELNKIKTVEGSFPQKDKEVVLSKKSLALLGYPNAVVGDQIDIAFQPFDAEGLGFERTEHFILSGLLTDEKETSGAAAYSMIVSEEIMKALIPEAERQYRVVVRVTPEYTKTVDLVEETGKKIGESFGLTETSILINTEYLFANYTDPSFISGMAVLILIISLAGALTIYSIYYVSLINKVQEFGKLKALGATKRQINRIVLLENMIVALLAIPTGLVLGGLLILFFFKQIMFSFLSGSELSAVSKEMLENGEIQIYIPWVFLLTAVIGLATVLISSLKPMRLASKISPMEAMNYTGQKEGSKGKRRGYISLSLEKLVGANLLRNKKRTLITVISLGLIGILFVTMATIFSCMNPDQIARDEINGDFRLMISNHAGNKMNPELEWSAIQQNNPLNEKMKKRIEDIPGVEKVNEHQLLNMEIPALMDDFTNKPLTSSIYGFNEDEFDEIKKNITEGSVGSFDELSLGNAVIADNWFSKNYPETAVGEELEVIIEDGDSSYTKKMTLIAKADLTNGQSGQGTFITSNQALSKLTTTNLTNTYDIYAEKNQLSAVQASLEAISKEHEAFELDDFEAVQEKWRSATAMTTGAGYGILFVLGIVGIMNLINTTIDSILSRKKELGVMQAIGMSGRQMRKMLQLEGIFYALGISGLSVGLGSLLGYLAYKHAAENGLMQIKFYQYPLLQVLLLVTLVFSVQLILTFATTNLVNKETIINRIRGAE
ncbi:ABC transporter permease [Enterococcus sp. LJL128]